MKHKTITLSDVKVRSLMYKVYWHTLRNKKQTACKRLIDNEMENLV